MLLKNDVQSKNITYHVLKGKFRKEDCAALLAQLVNVTAAMVEHMKSAKAKLRVIAKNSKRLSDEEQHELQRQHEVNLIMGDLEKETGKVDLWLKSLEGVMQGEAPTMVGPAIDINALKAEL